MSIVENKIHHVDAVVVGAGFAGLYMLHLLRDKMNMKTAVFESADDVGGTWYWNRYPGARCDIPSHHYSYSFSKEVQQEWNWPEKYSTQSDILKYLEFVAEKFDLRKDITFETRVVSAKFNDDNNQWIVKTNKGETYSAKYFIPAVGTLSAANIPKFEGHGSFKGDVYFTGQWPKNGVDFKGKRVGIIGTGATAIQVIPIVAEEAKHLTVFQRTPNYAAPLRNEVMTKEEDARIKANYNEIRRQSWDSFAGVPFPKLRESALDDTKEERLAHYEDLWEEGGFSLWIGSYRDILFNKEANETAAEFVRSKIKERVKDPAVADMLTPPEGQTYGTKRQPCDTGYFEAYNRDNVKLVDVKADPIKRVTPEGIDTEGNSFEFDIIIYATGFDAFTGALFKMDIVGKNGLTLKEHWGAGPRTYLGLMATGFPNMFTITGPQSPSVLFNMPLGIETHCEWIYDCMTHMRENSMKTIEVNKECEDQWIKEVKELADTTLLPEATSWYMGANIPGKARVFMVYLGGGKVYKGILDQVSRDKYPGFTLNS